jgi:hypothetical protein
LKATYDAYSKGMIGFKATLMAAGLAGLKIAFDGGMIPIDEKFIVVVSTVSSAFLIFCFDMLFNFLVSCINDFEVSRRKKNIDKKILELKDLLTNNSDKAQVKKINEFITQLQNEKINLIAH